MVWGTVLQAAVTKVEALRRHSEMLELIQNTAGSLLVLLSAMVQLTTSMGSLRNRCKPSELLGKQVVCVFGCFQEVVGGWMRTTMKMIGCTC